MQVIKLEYHIGAHIAWAVAALGAALALASLTVPRSAPSGIMGVLGGTLIWGATELPEQVERVPRSLFPANPRKQAHQSGEPSGSGETEGESE